MLAVAIARSQSDPRKIVYMVCSSRSQQKYHCVTGQRFEPWWAYRDGLTICSTRASTTARRLRMGSYGTASTHDLDACPSRGRCHEKSRGTTHNNGQNLADRARKTSLLTVGYRPNPCTAMLPYLSLEIDQRLLRKCYPGLCPNPGTASEMRVGGW